MKQNNTRTVLVVLAIVTTVFMFVVGVLVSVPGIAGTLGEIIGGVIVGSILLAAILYLLCLVGVDKLHAYVMEWDDRENALRQKKADREDALQQKKADREHFYQHHRKRREIELEQYKQLLRPRRYRIKRCARYLRHLKRRRKDD